MPHELVSAIFELGPLPVGFTNHHAQSWVLRVVGRCAPQVSADAHEKDAPRPFTVWAGTYEELGGAYSPVHPRATALLRVTSVSEPMSVVLRELAAAPPRETAFGSQFVPVLSATTNSVMHPLAACTPAAALAAEAQTGPLDRRVTLHFLTPTAFGSRPKQLFPLADRVFGYILHLWNAYVSENERIPAAVAAHLQRALQVESHFLATREPVRLAGFREKGFVGWCEYSVARDAPPSVARALQLLARASFFTGVGGRTAMGMGQVVWEPVARGAKPIERHAYAR